MHIAISIAGIVTQAYGVLCDSSSFNVHFASVYLNALDFVAIRCVYLLLRLSQREVSVLVADTFSLRHSLLASRYMVFCFSTV
jgi:hypothetical protein